MNSVIHPNIQQERVAQLREYCTDHGITGWSDQDLAGLLALWSNSLERTQAYLKRAAWVAQHQPA